MSAGVYRPLFRGRPPGPQIFAPSGQPPTSAPIVAIKAFAYPTRTGLASALRSTSARQAQLHPRRSGGALKQRA